jgi:hypothetical protein
MLDDFRQQANEGSLFEDDDPLEFEELGDFDQEYEDYEDEESGAARKKSPFLGMTAQQRFIIASMAFVLVLVLGVLTLLVTGRLVI